METKSPLKSPPHRLPGQSVEEERGRLIEDGLEQWFLAAAFMVGVAVMEWIRWALNAKPTPVLYSLVAIALCGFAAWRYRRVAPRLRALKLARDGERFVGQLLEDLRSQGYRVFHDLVADGFNVDHVVIGPAGVFTIETKTWSKPARGPAEIHFDGEKVRVGTMEPDRNPVVQAKAQATWIKGLLKDSVGKEPYVKPVVVFPGWWIVNSKQTFSDVWVLEPKALPKFLAKEPARISDSDVHLFSHHLSLHLKAAAP